jgi:hypothetical protein
MTDQAYLRDPNNWELVEGEVYSVAHMDHEDIVSSILDDLLLIHFETSMSQGIHWVDLMRFIKTEEQRERVLTGLLDYRVQVLIEDKDQIIRIRPSREVLQAAMNIAGHWWKGYEIPEGEEVIALTDAGMDMVEQLGADGAAAVIIAEMESPPVSKLVN